jgi:Mechanosensitive ion channel
MNDFLKEAVSLSLLGKCVAAVVGILFIYATFRVLEQTLPRRFGRADARYRVRKFVVYCGYLAILLFLALLFEDRLGRLSFALGVAGAGVAVALQDVLASIAGAFSIGFSKLYAVGDRVQIGDIRGDVIDIGLLRTTLMETGNWVSKDLYNGRIARIPNSTVLKGSVFNYSQGFRFIWDEITQSSWNSMSENYQSENPPLEPTVALVVNSGSLEFTVSYVVDYTKRTAMQDQLFTKIAEEVAGSNGQLKWASSAITVISQSATPDPIEARQTSSILGAGEAAGSVNRDR